MNEFDLFFSLPQSEFEPPGSDALEEPNADALLPEGQESLARKQPGCPDQAEFSGAFAPPALADPAFAAQNEELPLEEHTPVIVRVNLRLAGQVFYFISPEIPVQPGQTIIAAMEQGPVLGEVTAVFAVDAPQKDHLNGTVLRPATAQDIAVQAENRILAAEASAFCKTCIRQRELDMKLVDVEVLHDRSKIIFFFTAPSRIDFRELVKDLVRNYRTRIELRQIGVRHETQMLGGLGNCGRVCCCHRHLRKFAPVTIKMAKEQNLFLNPAKLSGMCGRLLCCLSFEQSNYDEFNRRCPKIGKKYTTDHGGFRVTRANMFSQTITGVNDNGEEVEFSLDEWEARHPSRAEFQGTEKRHLPQGRTKSMPHESWGDDEEDLREDFLEEEDIPENAPYGTAYSAPEGRPRRKKKPDRGRAPAQSRARPTANRHTPHDHQGIGPHNEGESVRGAQIKKE